MPPSPNCSWKTRRASPVNISAAVCESPNCSTRTVPRLQLRGFDRGLHGMQAAHKDPLSRPPSRVGHRPSAAGSLRRVSRSALARSAALYARVVEARCLGTVVHIGYVRVILTLLCSSGLGVGCFFVAGSRRAAGAAPSEREQHSASRGHMQPQPQDAGLEPASFITFPAFLPARSCGRSCGRDAE